MIYLAIKLKQIAIYHICMRRPGGGGGETQATIAIYDKYINNSRRAQYALIVSQNLISNDLLAIKGEGGGVTQATIDIHHRYINNSTSAHFKRAQCKLIVCQNLISNDLFGN